VTELVVDWESLFSKVCSRGATQLTYGLPEQWVTAELYAELMRGTSEHSIKPFRFEVPYYTTCPVIEPKGGKPVKWADLCLHHEASNQWWWFELKVRRIRKDPKSVRLGALRAFRRDIAALLYFNLKETAKVWRDPGKGSDIWYIHTDLIEHQGRLESGSHRAVTAYLQVGEHIDTTVWKQETLDKELGSWVRYHCPQEAKPAPPVRTYQVGNHGLAICEWPLTGTSG
jgi:hypothetical protein